MRKACPRTGRICMPGCTECRPAGTRNPRRNLTDHVRWARALKRRTPYCQRCGSREKLDAHHINGIDDPRGLVLCSACHCIEDPFARPR